MKQILCAAAAALLLTACGPDRSSSTKVRTEQPSGAAQQPPAAAGSAQPQVTPQNTAPAAPPPGGATATVPLDMQANHPNGSVLRVTGIQFGENSTSVQLAFTNGSRFAVALNGNRDFLLVDNLGGKYFVAAPPENPSMSVQPGTTLEGTITFMGRLAPQATSITLITNEKLGSTDSEYSRRPQMRLALDVKR